MIKSNKFFLILFIVLIFEFGYLLKMNSRMENIINRTKYEWSYHEEMQSSINDQLNDLYDQMNDILDEDESKQWIQGFSYSFLNLNEDYTKVNTQFNVSFKELYNGSEIYIIATNIDDENDFEKIYLEKITDLSYGVTIELDKNKDYSIDIVSESNFLRQREHLKEINFTDEKRNYISSVSWGERDFGPIYITNKHYGLEELKLTKIYVKLYNENTLIKELDITNLVNLVQSETLNKNEDTFCYDEIITFSNEYKSIKLEIIFEDQLGTYTIEENLDF